LLDLELQYLTELDIDFDVTVTGFELPEIDLLIGELLNANENDPADAIVLFSSRAFPAPIHASRPKINLICAIQHTHYR